MAPVPRRYAGLAPALVAKIDVFGNVVTCFVETAGPSNRGGVALYLACAIKAAKFGGDIGRPASREKNREDFVFGSSGQDSGQKDDGFLRITPKFPKQKNRKFVRPYRGINSADK
jgi:hypothetical protein